ncbi:MAG: PaaI family thioesterase [Paraburkholderia sp.]|nr:MAG: PaaI family thioesterase [Paraburkholderia sp.]TAM31461.1 MAG: PaaI family thioesterase [Paraburkholderia sp.]
MTPELLSSRLMAPANDASSGVPDGYTLFEHGGPYFRALGPLYTRPATAGGLIVAVRVKAAHTNPLGIAHGGMLLTLADGTLGIYLSQAPHAQRGAHVTVTTTLNSEFLSAAHVGDWLEAHARVRRNGRRIVFAECTLRVGEREVLHTSGTFLPIDR